MLKLWHAVVFKVILYNPIEIYQCFRGRALKMEAVGFLKTLVNFYRTTNITSQTTVIFMVTTVGPVNLTSLCILV